MEWREKKEKGKKGEVDKEKEGGRKGGMLGRRKKGKEEGKKGDIELYIKPERNELIGNTVPRTRSSREFSMPVPPGPGARPSVEHLAGLHCMYGGDIQRSSMG